MGSKEDPKSAVIHLVSFDSDIPCSAGFCEKIRVSSTGFESRKGLEKLL